MTTVKILEVTGWEAALDAARVTRRKPLLNKMPSREWKLKMLRAEHSPIRLVTVRWVWEGLPYWVSVHFVRHKVGIEHFVSTQREDITHVPRNTRLQTELVNHMCVANAQAIINISRRRLCKKASPETRQAWQMFVDALAKVDPELASVCVPNCVYRGRCYELEPCGRRIEQNG
ncbi:thymidylate synthase ThyX [Caldanaerobius polysaccharolyticus]|uniref:thymidylate synthase ThyX n=1 Tax=Caldanaerobius polysaccharolyticus TaxID=44256 RepID=UPI001FE21AE8|nr:thymidylate synthase ThyX [Caldanaerobius polysaccharolyticus]